MAEFALPEPPEFPEFPELPAPPEFPELPEPPELPDPESETFEPEFPALDEPLDEPELALFPPAELSGCAAVEGVVRFEDEFPLPLSSFPLAETEVAVEVTSSTAHTARTNDFMSKILPICQ
ncbi:MAG: hypothetical protein ACO321_07770 [Ilumatobacteraceae bacterium]